MARPAQRVLAGRQSLEPKPGIRPDAVWPKWGRQGHTSRPPERGEGRTLRSEAGDEDILVIPHVGDRADSVRSTRPAWGAFDLATGESGGMPPLGGGPTKAPRVKSSTMISARKGLPVSLGGDGAKQRTLTTDGYPAACPFWLGKANAHRVIR